MGKALPEVKNIMPAPKMIPPAAPRSKGGSGQVGDTIELARHILIHQRVPQDRKEQKALARWCLSLACVFEMETMKQIAETKSEKEKEQ